MGHGSGFSPPVDLSWDLKKKGLGFSAGTDVTALRVAALPSPGW